MFPFKFELKDALIDYHTNSRPETFKNETKLMSKEAITIMASNKEKLVSYMNLKANELNN